MTRFRAGCVSLAVAFTAQLLVACSSDQRDTGSHDVALSRITVQRSDLPRGWQPLRSPPGTANDRDQEAALACGHAPGTDSHVVQRVHSQFQNDPNSRQIVGVTSQVERMRSQADVDTDVSTLTSKRALACYRAVLRKQLPRTLKAGARLMSVRFTAKAVRDSYPTNVVALETGRAKILSGGQATIMFFDLAHITGPRLEALVAVTAVGRPADPRLEQQVIALVAHRAATG
jgi:hypothetical protein